MSLSPLVTVVIVTWNNENDIYDCLKSIYEQDYDNYNIVVIDNASKDNTKRIIKDSFPQVELIEKDKNLFLTGGNNAGIKYALKQYDSEYILVLNPDTYSPRYLISELVKPFHSAKKIGAVGPKVKFWKNK
ncbi:partial Teichoic acid poly(glycerol phosphate) polymerase, partial [Patescibacteria group bacterium]